MLREHKEDIIKKKKKKKEKEDIYLAQQCQERLRKGFIKNWFLKTSFLWQIESRLNSWSKTSKGQDWKAHKVSCYNLPCTLWRKDALSCA